MLGPEEIRLLAQCQKLLQQGFAGLPPQGESIVSDEMAAVVRKTAERLWDNFPYHHPYYLGQMLKPPHPVAMLAYWLAMSLNPNNHALDGGRATSEMERESVRQIAEMFGFETHLGHLCSGGTVANFEALWVARELTDGKGVAASSLAHYTHERLSAVLQVPFHSVKTDTAGRMDLAHLKSLLKRESIGTVVATLGTTGLGSVDPLADLIPLKQKYDFRLHVDAAYGGYFTLDETLGPDASTHFAAIPHVDSIVVDPHKHGLQPYGCGCVLFQDKSVAAIYKHESPYTYFTSDDLHLGEISLECSRAGAAAAALWATTELFPLKRGGEFAQNLSRCRSAAGQIFEWVQQHSEFQAVVTPELDIVCWLIRSSTSSQSSQLARDFFNRAAARNVHLALFNAPASLLADAVPASFWDEETVTCLRVCTMKPEHDEWMPRIIAELNAVLQEMDLPGAG